MKFKLDENLPIEGALLLAESGFDAMTVFDQHLVGESDARILEVCKHEDRVLITLDLDFADIRTYPPQDHCGIIVLRLKLQDKLNVVSILRRIVPLFDQESVNKHLWIVDDNKIRVRG